MAFSLDRIANFVQIDEPNLISIHRSTKIEGGRAIMTHF